MLSKQLVACRQLESAIQLLFFIRDQVSAYSLASNAWELIDSLCRSNSLRHFSKEVEESIRNGVSLKHDYINKPYRNYLKHADRDPESTLPDLPDSHVEGLLFMAVADYIRLAGKAPIALQVFQIWYLAKLPDGGVPPDLDNALVAARESLPNLRYLDQSSQIRMGADLLIKSLNDADLVKHPKTEQGILSSEHFSCHACSATL